MDCKGTGQNGDASGDHAGEVILESVYELIRTGEPETEAVDVEIIDSDQDAAYVVLFV